MKLAKQHVIPPRSASLQDLLWMGRRFFFRMQTFALSLEKHEKLYRKMLTDHQLEICAEIAKKDRLPTVNIQLIVSNVFVNIVIQARRDRRVFCGICEESVRQQFS